MTIGPGSKGSTVLRSRMIQIDQQQAAQVSIVQTVVFWAAH